MVDEFCSAESSVWPDPSSQLSVVLALVKAGDENPAFDVEHVMIQPYRTLTTHLQALQFERQPVRTRATLRSD